jgi:glycosyltransferase involved in cell wall biosynthesis
VAVRVAHVITRADVGGAQTHVVELSAEQSARGDDVVVIAGCDGPAADRIRRRGIDVCIVPALGQARSGALPGSAYRDVRAAIRIANPDIVHAHSSHAGLIARSAAWRGGLPSVYTAHGWPFQAGAPWSQRIVSFAGEFIAGRLGDAVICLTEVEADRARRARVVRRGRVWVVGNGLSDVAPELRYHTHTGVPAIVMVARFAPPKRQAEVIEVLATITDAEWTVTFVGDGPQQSSCVELANRLLGSRAEFLGERDDVASILAAHDIAVLWSGYEGLPISLLEAMRAGLCCVGSDLPGVRVLLGDPPVGRVVASRSELACTFRELVADRSTRRALGDRARMRYEQSFSSGAMEAAVRAVYEAVCAR